MASNYDAHLTEMDEDRMSDISSATTCFGGHKDNPHINELREMRSSINKQRRELLADYKKALTASPEDLEDMEPDLDLARAHYGRDIVEYVNTARRMVTNGSVSEYM